MISKSLIKLIDEAIIPVVFLIIAKMTTILAVSYFLKFPVSIQNGQVFYYFPGIHFSNLQDYIIAENYSNLAMFSAAAFGTVLVLIRAHFFHESHIHPTLAAKLTSLNLEKLISTNYHVYHQAAIWMIFLWLTVGFLIISTMLKITYPQLSIIAFIIAANFSWVFAVDVEKEIELSR